MRPSRPSQRALCLVQALSLALAIVPAHERRAGYAAVEELP
jgi:hypothetical protein